jgi:flagellar FliJ protein
MKKFSFKLDTLIEIRKRKEDEIKLLLAEQNRKIIEEQKKLNSLHDELKALQQKEKEERNNAANILSMRYSVVFRYKLKKDILEKGRKVDDMKAEAFKIQKKLIHATKEKRAIELMREHRHEEWKKEYLSEEQGFIDDISQQKFIRENAEK